MNILPSDQLKSNLKTKIEGYKLEYALKVYAFAIKTVAGTINLESEFPLAAKFANVIASDDLPE